MGGGSHCIADVAPSFMGFHKTFQGGDCLLRNEGLDPFLLKSELSIISTFPLGDAVRRRTAVAIKGIGPEMLTAIRLDMNMRKSVAKFQAPNDVCKGL